MRAVVKPMSRRATVIALVSGCLAVVAVLGIKRAFEPPVPLEKVRAIKQGMTEQQVRQILGAPTQVLPGGQAYTVKGTNYLTDGQWTYTLCSHLDSLTSTLKLAASPSMPTMSSFRLNHPTAGNAGLRPWLSVGCNSSGVPEPGR